MLKMMLVGWENMKEENGEDIPFNNQNLKDMMEDSYWLKAVSTSYTASLIEDKVKNQKRQFFIGQDLEKK